MSKSIRQWQKIIGAEVDGKFGPNTLRKSIEYAEKDGTPVEKQSIESNKFTLTKTSRPVNEIIIHCAATPEGRDVSVETIRAWHKQRGWNDIGYHYIVLLDGTIKEGRPVSKTGAHVHNRNKNTIGIVYVGGVDKSGKAKDTRTPAQKDALLWLTKNLAKMYNVSLISGHNQYAAKACPSFDVRTDKLGNIPGYSKGVRK